MRSFYSDTVCPNFLHLLRPRVDDGYVMTLFGEPAAYIAAYGAGANEE